MDFVGNRTECALLLFMNKELGSNYNDYRHKYDKAVVKVRHAAHLMRGRGGGVALCQQATWRLWATAALLQMVNLKVPWPAAACYALYARSCTAFPVPRRWPAC